MGILFFMVGYDMIILFIGRWKKFVFLKFNVVDIKWCVELWVFSGIIVWICEMVEGELDLKRKIIEEGVFKFFCVKVLIMNVVDVEFLSVNVVEFMFVVGILIFEEEWVKFGKG